MAEENKENTTDHDNLEISLRSFVYCIIVLFTINSKLIVQAFR